jgi:hypothetical protein
MGNVGFSDISEGQQLWAGHFVEFTIMTLISKCGDDSR